MTDAESLSTILPPEVEDLLRSALGCAVDGGPAAHRVERFGAIGRGPVRIAAMRVALEMLDEVV